VVVGARNGELDDEMDDGRRDKAKSTEGGERTRGTERRGKDPHTPKKKQGTP